MRREIQYSCSKEIVQLYGIAVNDVTCNAGAKDGSGIFHE